MQASARCSENAMLSGFVIIDVSRQSLSKNYSCQRERSTCQIPWIVIMDLNNAILILYTMSWMFLKFYIKLQKCFPTSLIIIDFDNSDNFFYYLGKIKIILLVMRTNFTHVRFKLSFLFFDLFFRILIERLYLKCTFSSHNVFYINIVYYYNYKIINYKL